MTRFERVFLIIAAVRAVTVVIDGDAPPGLLFLAGCVLAWRWGWVWLGISAFATCVLMGGSNSVVLVGWVALALAWFDGRELERVLRVQTVTVYAFAVAHKMISDAFVSGQTIADNLPGFPWPQQMAGMVLFLEATLAVGVLRRWPVLPVAVVAHVGFAVGVATSVEHFVALAAFNGLMVLLVWRCSQVDQEPMRVHQNDADTLLVAPVPRTSSAEAPSWF